MYVINIYIDRSPGGDGMGPNSHVWEKQHLNEYNMPFVTLDSALKFMESKPDVYEKRPWGWQLRGNNWSSAEVEKVSKKVWVK